MDELLRRNRAICCYRYCECVNLKDRLTVHTTVHWVEVQKMKLVFFVRAHVYIYNAENRRFFLLMDSCIKFPLI